MLYGRGATSGMVMRLQAERRWERAEHKTDVQHAETASCTRNVEVKVSSNSIRSALLLFKP